jgi:arsenite methyltransferase
MEDSQQDIWSRWLLERRFGGDMDRMKVMTDYLYPLRDKVLSHVRLAPGETLLDVGCGDGLIAFGALEKFEGCRVIFSDISDDLLRHAEALASEMSLRQRCQFVHASADDLSMLADGSVDAVTTRSVLIYVSDKRKSFQEFYRVLAEGGQLSIFEPINRFAFPEPPDRFEGYDVTPVMDLADKLKALYFRIQPLDSDPMLDFDERDLIAHAERAGFPEIHLELQAYVKPPEIESWSTLLNAAFNPKIPTLAEAMQEALTPEETERFSAHLRPLVDARQGTNKLAVAYLWATK